MEGLKLNYGYDKFESKTSNEIGEILPSEFVEIKNVF